MKKGFLNDKKLTSKKAASSVSKTATGSYKLAPAADPFITTTQPSQFLNATQESSPDGWAECYISGYVKRKLLETPGYPAPIPHLPTKPVHRLTETPSRGLTMFATRFLITWSMLAAEKLRAGDIILCERPIIVFPAAKAEQIIFPDHFTEVQRHQAFLYEQEMRLEMLFARVPSWNQKAYKELFNSHTQDGSGPLLGILRTNGFQIGLQDKAQGLRGAYSGVFDQLSRLNHSCMPNVERHWDTRSFCMFIRASHDIQKGEELTIAYCPLPQSAAEQIVLNLPRIEEFALWFVQPEPRGLSIIQKSIRQLRLIEEEGLESDGLSHLIVLVHAYLLLTKEFTQKGETEKLQEYDEAYETYCTKLAAISPYGPKAYQLEVIQHTFDLKKFVTEQLDAGSSSFKQEHVGNLDARLNAYGPLVNAIDQKVTLLDFFRTVIS
ncbi:hypothetical protein C8J56DRAFT_1043355 [Mycena floridula]|nr:hypothetical protein C8J56DRAFT_1043355 [Mycena floridula]